MNAESQDIMIKSKEGIHVLARAIIVFEGKILVTTDTNRNISFLPGGHVHYSEKAKDALTRELREELGVSANVGDFLGVIEAGWEYKKQLYHEYNLIFKINQVDAQFKNKIKQMESNLALEWIAIDSIEGKNIYPVILKENITKWIQENTNNRYGSEWA